MFTPRHRRVLAVAATLAGTALPLASQTNSPGGLVPVNLLVARRAALLNAMPAGVAYLASSKTRATADYAQDSDYRENNDFFYYTGVESPGGVLLFVKTDSAGPGEVRLYLNAPPAVADAWSAARTSADTAAARISGLTMRQICAHPPRAGGRGGAAATPAPVVVPAGTCVPLPFTPRTTPLEAPVQAVAPAGRGGGGGGAAPAVTPPVADSIARALNVPVLTRGGISRAIANGRGVKDADEIRRLTRASEISAEAHRAAMLNSRPGMWEYEIEGIVEYTFRRRGAERVGYPSIVGSGPNSTILHYDISRRQAKDGDLVLIDAAAEFGYYTADLTRTFPVNGKFTPRQKAIYELVLGAQQAAMDSVRPGQTLARLGQIASAYLREKGGTLCGTETTCDRMMGHGLSHSVGMDVHDVNPAFREMQPGYAFTIEPGVYLPKEGFGVRIEDTILVTETGYINLTKGVPRTVAEVEALMASGKTKGVDALRP